MPSTFLLLLSLPLATLSFTTPVMIPTTTTTTKLYGSITTTNADFEFQEMRAILNAMNEQNIPSKKLEMTKRIELESYIDTVVRERIPTSTKLPLEIPTLLSSTYRLAYSNQSAVDLPADATVYLQFLSEHRLSYQLKFSKRTLGLQNLKAECSYDLDQSNGVLTFTYDTVTTDVFGFKNLSIGMFGMLQGRKNYIVTAYFDGEYWIEVAYDSPAQSSTYTNVYVKVDNEDDDWRKS